MNTPAAVNGSVHMVATLFKLSANNPHNVPIIATVAIAYSTEETCTFLSGSQTT